MCRGSTCSADHVEKTEPFQGVTGPDMLLATVWWSTPGGLRLVVYTTDEHLLARGPVHVAPRSRTLTSHPSRVLEGCTRRAMPCLPAMSASRCVALHRNLFQRCSRLPPAILLCARRATKSWTPNYTVVLLAQVPDLLALTWQGPAKPGPQDDSWAHGAHGAPCSRSLQGAGEVGTCQCRTCQCRTCPCTAALMYPVRYEQASRVSVAAASSGSKQRQLTAAAGPANPCPLPASVDRTLMWTIRRQVVNNNALPSRAEPKPSRVETSRVELLGIEYPVAAAHRAHKSNSISTVPISMPPVMPRSRLLVPTIDGSPRCSRPCRSSPNAHQAAC